MWYYASRIAQQCWLVSVSVALHTIGKYIHLEFAVLSCTAAMGLGHAAVLAAVTALGFVTFLQGGSGIVHPRISPPLVSTVRLGSFPPPVWKGERLKVRLAFLDFD